MKLLLESWNKYLTESDTQDSRMAWLKALEKVGVIQLSDKGLDEGEETLPPDQLPRYGDLASLPRFAATSKLTPAVNDKTANLPVINLTPEFMKSEDSGFCVYNPQINSFAEQGPNEMAKTLLFVLATIRTTWPRVIGATDELFHFLENGGELIGKSDQYSTAESILKDMQDKKIFSNESPEGRMKIANNLSFITGTPGFDFYNIIWKNRESIYSNIMPRIERYKETNDPFELYTTILRLKGFGLPKAGFAAQMLVGRFGCIDSINQSTIYSGAVPPLLKGKKPVKEEAFIKAAMEYRKLLQELESSANIDCKNIWDAWTKLVAFQINNPGTPYAVITKNNAGMEKIVVRAEPSARYNGGDVERYRALTGKTGPVSASDISAEHHPAKSNKVK